MKLNYCLSPYTKANSKWIKDLNVSHETIKLLEENIGNNLLNINVRNFFLNTPPRARETKANMNTWDYIKLKKLLYSKGHNQQNKRASYSRENIFVNDVI